jgi:hypothetical protein
LAAHVARTEKLENAYILIVKPEVERDHSRDLGVDVIATYNINIVDVSHIVFVISNMASGDNVRDKLRLT